jgi:single-strand DNA-binding protein
VIVQGQLKTRTWETPEGDKRQVVEVTAEEAGPSLRWATAKPQRAAAKTATGKTATGKAGGQAADDPPF